MKYTDKQIEEAVLSAAKELGDDLSVAQYLDWRSTRDNVPSWITIYNRYGSWNSLKEHLGLETNKVNYDKPPNFRVTVDGYEQIRHHDGEKEQSFLHSRLLATLLVDDIEELRDMHAHHRSRHKWLNTIDNISVLSPSEHNKLHQEQNAAIVTLSDETERIPLEKASLPEGDR